MVNLSHEPRVFAALLYGGGVEEAMALISQPTFAHKKLLVMLLANMTQKEEGASRLLQVRQEADWGRRGWGGMGMGLGMGWGLEGEERRVLLGCGGSKKRVGRAQNHERK